jgi:hypothetical protein
MADWVLIPAGRALFAAFDDLAPGRDTASDGAVGDAAHAAETSDHNPDETGSVPIHDADHVNEVHAIDVDDDLRTPGLTMEAVVQFVLGRVRSGAERRLRYMIYNRRIWEADNGWAQRTYTGASAHTEHAHFSFSYTTSLEANTGSWHLEEINVPLEISDAQLNDIASRVWAFQLEYPESDATPKAKKPAGTYIRYADTVAITTRTTIAAEVAAQLAPVNAALDALQAAVAALNGGVE